MTLDEISQAITPTGHTAAIIGVILCIAVLSVRFRARNLATTEEPAETEPPVAEDEKDAAPETGVPTSVPEPAKPTSPFKTFSPSDAKSSGDTAGQE
jgi:hypothetical protein